MNLEKIQNKKDGISPIIATLLLILIAIAAGVIVYAYVIGFIGQTTTGQAVGTSNLSIDTASGSAGGSTVVAYFRNIGGNTATVVAIYVLDNTETPVAGGTIIGTVAASSASACGTISNAGGMACTLSAGASDKMSLSGVTLTNGQTYSVKITTADGSTVISLFKAGA